MAPMTDWTRDVARLVEHGRDWEAAAVAVGHLPRRQGERMDPLEQLDQLAPLLGAANELDVSQLDAPTPCTEFTVRDVLEHMIAGGTAFAAMFRGETPSGDAGAGDGDTVARFNAAMAELVDAMRSPGALERTIPAPFGDVPGDVFARFVVLDGLVHAWDIATATGLPFDPPQQLVEEVHAFARQAITPAMRDAGMFAPATDAPADAGAVECLAAYTGRKVSN
jgi:uncharacterized protein (TIGR03086 family)